MYYPFIRKAFFQLDPKHTHEFTFQQSCRIIGTLFGTLVRQKMPAKPVNYMGLTLKNPLGPAAGFDKDGECVDVLSAMEFRSIEIGTVTSRPQLGNNKPRPFRLVDAEGLINRMGFNNLGADSPVGNVKKAHYDGVLGISVGKNKDTPVEQGKDDYLIYTEKIYAYAGYTAVNTLSPNAPGLRTLRYGETLDDLLTAIKNKQNDLQTMHHKYMSITVEIASSLSEEGLIQVVDNSARYNTDGVITTNTALDRSLVQEVKNCDQTGGLSDCPLQLKSTGIIRHLSLELNGRLSITGVGSIGSITAAREKTATGISLVRIYSGFIFKGPPLIKEIVTHI